MSTQALTQAVERNTKSVNDLADRIKNQPPPVDLDQVAVDAATTALDVSSATLDSLVPAEKSAE